MTTKYSGTQIFASIVTAAITVAVVAGLIIAGSPTQERMRRADQQRVSDLQAISYAIDAYWNQNDVLPTSLADLARSPNVYLQSVNDPKTDMGYTYRPQNGGSYELCATFEADSDSGPDQPAIPQPTGFWSHGVGERCFRLEAQPNNVLKPAPVVR